MSTLLARELTKIYPAKRSGQPTAALESLDFEIKNGEFVCLLGPSGCGKSTLLNMVAGFLEASSGSLTLSGQQVSGPAPDRGVVFQEDALFPWMSAEDNVAFGPEMKGIQKETARGMAREALATVGLTGFERHLPRNMSGGMKQRVAIARVLVNDPEIMLFDEPFSALDAFTRESLQQEMVRVWTASPRTVLFVTHNVEEAILLATRIMVMGTSHSGGRVLKDLEVNLPRPRDTTGKEFNEVKREILDTLHAGDQRATLKKGA